MAAYLNVILKKHEAPIFLRAPQGMHGVPAGHVLQLNINLYGLCEAAWRWYMDLSSTMATQGWTKSNFESCLWHRQDDPKDKTTSCCTWTTASPWAGTHASTTTASPLTMT